VSVKAWKNKDLDAIDGDAAEVIRTTIPMLIVQSFIFD